MPNIKQPLDQSLFDLIMAHLAMLKQYVPGPVKKAGGAKEQLLERYSNDPLYSIFGLDSPEYVAATLGGGTITSIHRKLGESTTPQRGYAQPVSLRHGEFSSRA